MHKAKIIATIGPASRDKDILEKLFLEGASIFRLNLSHKLKEELIEDVDIIRGISRKRRSSITIIADLPGPKIRVSNLKDDLLVNESETIFITKNVINEKNTKKITLNNPNIIDDIKIGESIFIDDGLIRLKIIGREKDDLICKILNDGIIKPNKGVNFPHSKLNIEYPTPKDIEWIEYITKNDLCDYFALSFIRTKEDVEKAKGIISSNNSKIKIIAKIEKNEAIKNLDSIIDLSDAIMVARGDLGIELPIEEVPLLQKMIIKRCNQAGKPVITATQMLESMVHNPTPTRAEVADIANAVLDGTDALMLSAETAVSHDPISVVKIMRKIIENTEESIHNEQIRTHIAGKNQLNLSDAIAYAASSIADDIKASYVVCLTTSGSTAQRISKYRPSVPILVLSNSEKVLNMCELLWGVKPIYAELTDDVAESIEISKKKLSEYKLTKPGDRIVFTLGTPMGVSGTTNLIEVINI